MSSHLFKAETAKVRVVHTTISQHPQLRTTAEVVKEFRAAGDKISPSGLEALWRSGQITAYVLCNALNEAGYLMDLKAYDPAEVKTARQAQKEGKFKLWDTRKS